MMDKVLGSIPRNTMQCLYAWKNVFEWSRRVEKLYVVQEMNWPYLYVAFHSMHTLWSSIHDSSSSSLSVFTVRSYMFMKINIYLMFIFIYFFSYMFMKIKYISTRTQHKVFLWEQDENTGQKKSTEKWRDCSVNCMWETWTYRQL